MADGFYRVTDSVEAEVRRMPVTSILFGQPVMVGEPPEPSFFSDLYRETFTGPREEVPA